MKASGTVSDSLEPQHRELCRRGDSHRGDLQSLQIDTIASGTQCLHANSQRVVSGTGSDCGSGSGITVANGFTVNRQFCRACGRHRPAGRLRPRHVTTYLASYDNQARSPGRASTFSPRCRLAPPPPCRSCEARPWRWCSSRGSPHAYQFGHDRLSGTHLYVSESLEPATSCIAYCRRGDSHRRNFQ